MKTISVTGETRTSQDARMAVAAAFRRKTQLTPQSQISPFLLAFSSEVGQNSESSTKWTVVRNRQFPMWLRVDEEQSSVIPPSRFRLRQHVYCTVARNPTTNRVGLMPRSAMLAGERNAHCTKGLVATQLESAEAWQRASERRETRDLTLGM